MKISFIGSGKVAWHLAKALENSNHEIVEVFSRNSKNALYLAKHLNISPTIQTNLDFSVSQAKVFIVAVTDDAISTVLSQIKIPQEAVVVHTSGTQSLDVFHKMMTYAHGILYPLQTFSKDKSVDIKQVPFLIEASDEQTKCLLFDLAKSISNCIEYVSSEKRKIIHLSAVVACNFVNYMWAVSDNILDKEGLSFDILKPLIRETLEKAVIHKPETVQTGPAIRKDVSTIQKHLDLLQTDESFQKIYALVSEDIMKKMGKSS